MTPLRWSRRDLGKLAGTGFLAAALRAFRAEAQTATPLKRIVLFFTPHGTVWDRWRPQGTPTVTNFTLPYILEPLASYQQKLVLLDGIGLPPDGPGAPHTRGPAVLFTGSPLASDNTFQRTDCSGGCTFGWNTYHSVDQEIATRLGGATPYKSLEFGVSSGGGFPGAYISYSAPAQPNPPMQDPYVAFQQLFANQVGSATDKDRKLARRLNVLRAVNGDLASLKTKVSTADATRLQAHVDSLAQIQHALQTSGAMCALPAQPAQKTTSDPMWRTWAMDRQIELLASSLACGLTQVASLQFRPGENDGGAQGIYDWLGQTTEHHLATHDSSTAAQDQIADIYRWYADRFAYLLQKLDSFPEATGTLLDHTLVIWGSELGEGRTHDITNVPFVIAGGGLEGVTGGRYLQFPAGTMNQRLLVSLCHYMGFTDVQTFGTIDQGTGKLPDLL
jgi:hypothetical protein